jgi:hypothetical protein
LETIKSSIETLTHSSLNPTVTPEDIINEVVTARGNMTDLEDRLDGVITVDGALVTTAAMGTTVQLQDCIGRKNLFPEGDFHMWGKGDTADAAVAAKVVIDAAADGDFNPSGTNFTNPQTETDRKIGMYAQWVEHDATVGANGQANCWVLDTGPFARLFSTGAGDGADWDDEMTITVGCWVKAQEAGDGSTVGPQLIIYDGSTSSTAAYPTTTNWEWISTSLTMGGSGTYIAILLRVEDDDNPVDKSDAVWSGLQVHFCSSSAINPIKWQPNKARHVSHWVELIGEPATQNGHGWVFPQTAFAVTHVQAFSRVAPTTGTVDISLKQWDGAGSAVDIVTSGAIIAQNDTYGTLTVLDTAAAINLVSSQPGWTASGIQHPLGALRLDVDATNAAEDLHFFVRGWEYVDPLAGVMDYNLGNP